MVRNEELSAREAQKEGERGFYLTRFNNLLEEMKKESAGIAVDKVGPHGVVQLRDGTLIDEESVVRRFSDCLKHLDYARDIPTQYQIAIKDKSGKMTDDIES